MHTCALRTRIPTESLVVLYALGYWLLQNLVNYRTKFPLHPPTYISFFMRTTLLLLFVFFFFSIFNQGVFGELWGGAHGGGVGRDLGRAAHQGPALDLGQRRGSNGAGRRSALHGAEVKERTGENVHA